MGSSSLGPGDNLAMKVGAVAGLGRQLVERALRHREGRVGGGYTAVDGRLEQHLGDLLVGQAVADGAADVERAAPRTGRAR